MGMKCGELAESIARDPGFASWRACNLQKVDAWAAHGLLEDIDPEKAKKLAESGFALKGCADGEQNLPDILPHLKEWMLTDRIHILSSHGGGVLVDPQFPFNQETFNASPYWVNEARLSYGLGYPVLFLLEHVPCKMAFLHGYSVVQQVRSALAAKRLVKREVPGMKVGMLLQVDRGLDCIGRKRHVTRLFRTRVFDPIVNPSPSLDQRALVA